MTIRSIIAVIVVLSWVFFVAPDGGAAQTGGSSDPRNCTRPVHLAPGETWVDPSPHQCGLVEVNGVRLHYLDWGGGGEALVLLHASGGTAHGFDDLAPRFTDRFRVLALTRRGHGQSDHPERGYTVAQTTADVVAFLDALGIGRAHLVAHSFAGAEITRLAKLHPERVLSLTYLDALPDWSDVEEVFGRNPVSRPRPPEDFVSSLDSRREWVRRTSYGLWSPALEADFRHVRFNPSAVQSLVGEAEPLAPEYARIVAPVLAIHTTRSVGTQFPWLLESNADPQERAHAQGWIDEALNPYLLAQIDELRRQLPNARVVMLEANHWVHVSNLEEITRVLRHFLLSGEPSS